MSNIKDRILAYQSQHPECTARELAQALGVSRQRIYQALARYELRAHSPDRRAIRECREQRVTGGVPMISSRMGGAVSELLAAVDLVARGYQVYRPIVDHRRYDIIAVEPDGTIVTIEVRTAKRNADGQVSFSRHSRLKADVFAIVVHGEPISYSPDVKTFAVGGSVTAHQLRKR